MDELSRLDSQIHRVAPLAKLLVTLAFIIVVISFDRYSVSALVPFVVFPVVMATVGGIPSGFILKSILIVSPFAVMVGIFNPLIDTDTMVKVFGVGVSGGWVSFASILLRFTLTVSSALILVSVTGFNSVCTSLEKLFVPKLFIVQLMFLYRYMFVLMDEGGRMIVAKSMRSFDNKTGFKVYISMLGLLLLRALDRAQRIHLAMYSRGFDGNFKMIKRTQFSSRDAIFVVVWISVFIMFRAVNVSEFIGGIVEGYL